MRLAEHGKKGFPRDIAEFLFLEILQTYVDMALGKLFKGTLLEQGHWT